MDGVANRLREEGMAVDIVPTAAQNPVGRLKEFRPDAVVMESPERDPSPWPEEVLRAVATTVICLDLERDELDVRTSRRIAGATTGRLVAAIRAALAAASEDRGGEGTIRQGQCQESRPLSEARRGNA